MSKQVVRAARRPLALGLCLLVAVVACSVPAPTLAGAAGGANAAPIVPSNGTTTPQWSFVPLSAQANKLTRSAIHVLAKPGQVVYTTAVLTNYSYTQTLYFEVYSSDATNTANLGAFTLNAPDAPKKDVGTWISLPVNNVQVAPRQSFQFHFGVHVPANARPGDHAGGVVALNLAHPVHPNSGTNLDIQRGEGIAVYVRVPGPRHPGIAATDIGATTSVPAIGFGSKWAKVHYEVVNTGNVLLNGTVQAEAVNIWGSVVKKFKPVPIDALIPGERFSVNEPKWDGLPFAGPVHVKVVMTTGAVKATDESTFWVVPWLLLLLVILVIVGLIAWLVWRRRRRRAQEVPPSGSGGTQSPPAATTPDAGAGAPPGAPRPGAPSPDHPAPVG